MREVPVESVALGLLTAGAPAGTPQADGDVGGTAVAVVRRDIGAWDGESETGEWEWEEEGEDQEEEEEEEGEAVGKE